MQTRISNGVFTITLSHVPEYGKVRIIFTENIEHTWYDDGVKEFTLTEVMRDPALQEIKRRIQI